MGKVKSAISPSETNEAQKTLRCILSFYPAQTVLGHRLRSGFRDEARWDPPAGYIPQLLGLIPAQSRQQEEGGGRMIGFDVAV